MRLLIEYIIDLFESFHQSGCGCGCMIIFVLFVLFAFFVSIPL